MVATVCVSVVAHEAVPSSHQAELSSRTVLVPEVQRDYSSSNEVSPDNEEKEGREEEERGPGDDDLRRNGDGWGLYNVFGEQPCASRRKVETGEEKGDHGQHHVETLEFEEEWLGLDAGSKDRMALFWHNHCHISRNSRRISYDTIEKIEIVIYICYSVSNRRDSLHPCFAT